MATVEGGGRLNRAEVAMLVGLVNWRVNALAVMATFDGLSRGQRAAWVRVMRKLERMEKEMGSQQGESLQRESQQPIAYSRQGKGEGQRPTADSRQGKGESQQPIAYSRQGKGESQQPIAYSRQGNVDGRRRK